MEVGGQRIRRNCWSLVQALSKRSSCYLLFLGMLPEALSKGREDRSMEVEDRSGTPKCLASAACSGGENGSV